MIENQSVRDTAAPVVTRKNETGWTQRSHHGHLVFRHLTLRIVDMAATARRLATIPAAAKIGSHDAEMFSESRAKLAPNNMGVRVAVQEGSACLNQQWRPNDDAIRDLDVIEREPRHQRGVSDLAHHSHHGVSPRSDSSTATRATESVQAWRHREASLILRPDYWPAEVTRQTVFPTSSAIRSAPVLSTASPTGRPLAFPSASRKSVTTSSAFPLGRPPLKGTKTTL
jgi:hypothetical protein